MQINKTDIIMFFEKREKQLKERKQIAEEKEKKDKTMLSKYEIWEINYRLQECNYIKTTISLLWDIINKKKEKKNAN